ncbi:MAG TPA: hypothetical protein VL550_05280 [Rhodocyclaceae bacterium]|nr:hypothetical protein [Rhodocyclaceae bacterium]
MSHVIAATHRHFHSPSGHYVLERLNELKFAVGVVMALSGAVILLSDVVRRLS